MPKLLPLKSSFAAGEISPRYAAQPDSEAFKNGAEYMLNVLSTPQGTAKSRGGMRYIGNASGELSVGFSFPVSTSLSFGLIATPTVLYPCTPYNRVWSNIDVTNWAFQNGSTGWTRHSSGDGGFSIFTTGSCAIYPPKDTGYEAVSTPVTVSYPNEDNRIMVNCYWKAYSAGFTVKIGTSANSDNLYSSGLINGWRLQDTFDPNGNTTVYVTIYCAHGGGSYKRLVVNEVRVYADGRISGVNIAHPWSISQLHQIQSAMRPGYNQKFFVHPNVSPRYLNYDVSTDTWTLNTVSFTSPPSVWTGTNWPATMCFWQGRSWWAGAPGEPEDIRSSRSGTVTDLTTGSLDDDALQLTLATKGAIRWLAPAKNLVLGTENAEHVITSDGGVVTPSDRNVDEESAFGSAEVASVKIGSKILYVSADGQKIRDIGYKWTENGWVSRDIMFTSEHLLMGKPVNRIAFAQNPDNLVALVTKDNELFMGTYERTNDIVGWQRQSTNGRVLDAFKWPFQGQDFLGLITKREFVTGTSIEIVDDETTMDANRVKYDSSLQTAIDYSGLANQTVQVKVDDAAHADVTLNAFGYGTLTTSGYKVEVGFEYTQQVDLLPLIHSVEGGGSSISILKRYNRVFLYLINSYVPTINDETPSEYETEPFTDYVQIPNLGWDRKANIVVKQTEPFKFELAGVFGEAIGEIL